jgi:glutamate dehydrogenase
MDYIGVKRFDRRRQADRRVPHRRAVHLDRLHALDPHHPLSAAQGGRVLTRAGFDPDSHSGKALVNVLESYPRDELFQIDEDTLYPSPGDPAARRAAAGARAGARDRFDRFVSVLVFVPRDRFDTTVRIAIGDYLAEVFKGRVSAFYPFFPEGPLTRVHFIIGRDEGRDAEHRPRRRWKRRSRDRAHLERRAREALR